MLRKVIFIILVFPMISFSMVELPHDKQLETQINETFYSDGNVSFAKTESFRENIEKRKDEIIQNIIQYETREKEESKNDAIEEAMESDSVFIYDLILKYLDEAQLLDNDIERRALYAKILELEYSALVEGVRLPIIKQIDFVKNFLKPWSISKTKTPEGEASNLYDPETGLYYGQETLRELKEAGKDLSLIDPKNQTSFWTKQNIEQVDIEKNYRGDNRLYKDIDIFFPETGVFKKVRKTQSKPKVDITTIRNGKKIKFKLKVGSEMHSEITSASLIAALGYNVDISKYVRDFKMILPKKTSFREFKKEWNSYYLDYDLDKYIKEKGKTEDGHEYIIWTEALIETKPEPIKRIGPWAWGENGHRSLREVRAILLFNMWVANLDLKEAENNKMVLKPSTDGEFEMFHYQHDMGFAFGRIFREKPGAFQWDLVSKVTPNAVHINFHNFQNNSGFDQVTFSDAKWMVRLIARLSREQITDAVKLGGWPKEIELLLIEKLISRRNQLVKAFELSNEFSELDYQRNITTETEILKNGILTQNLFDGYTQDFGNEIKEVLRPLFDGVKTGLISLAQKTAGMFEQIVINPKDLGIKTDLIAEVKITFARKIVKNQNQKGRDDNYLVEDKMELSFGLAQGYILKGRSNFVKEYKVIYPVKTKDEGRFHNRFIVNVLLPYHISKNRLPEKYVMILEDSLELLGAIELADASSLLSTEVSQGVIYLGRVAISNQHKELQVYFDKSRFNDTSAKVYAQLLIFKIPFFGFHIENGVLNREVYKIKYSNDQYETIMKDLSQFIVHNNFKPLEEKSKKTTLSTNFNLQRHRLNFFNIFQTEGRRRIDHIEKNKSDKKSHRFQMLYNSEMEWNILGNGETKDYQIAIAGKAEGNKIKKPLVHMTFNIEDKNTHTSELSTSYINAINKLANDNQFINFSPSLHSKNNLWGETHLNIHILYDEEGINKLLNTSASDFWNRLSSRTGLSKRKLTTAFKAGNRRSHKTYKYKVAEKLTQVLNYFDKAKRATSDQMKYRYVVDAFSQANWQENGSYNVEILSIFNEIIGEEHHYLEGKIDQASDTEMKYPDRVPLFNSKGDLKEKKLKYYEFDFESINSIWDNFDNQ